jgi:hypothetical protein
MKTAGRENPNQDEAPGVGQGSTAPKLGGRLDDENHVSAPDGARVFQMEDDTPAHRGRQRS